MKAVFVPCLMELWVVIDGGDGGWLGVWELKKKKKERRKKRVNVVNEKRVKKEEEEMPLGEEERGQEEGRKEEDGEDLAVLGYSRSAQNIPSSSSSSSSPSNSLPLASPYKCVRRAILMEDLHNVISSLAIVHDFDPKKSSILSRERRGEEEGEEWMVRVWYGKAGGVGVLDAVTRKEVDWMESEGNILIFFSLTGDD